jgi:Bacterial PH domain
MITFNEAHVQLMQAKAQVKFVGVAEVQQLAKLLDPQEEVLASVKCWHNSSVALVCVTTKRLLVIDTSRGKKRITSALHQDITMVRHQAHYSYQTIAVQLQKDSLFFYAWRKKYANELVEKLVQHVEHSKVLQQQTKVYAVPVGVTLLRHAALPKA